MGDPITVATLSDLPPGACRHVNAAGREVALFNVGGTIYAIGGICTHRGGSLGEGGARVKIAVGRKIRNPKSQDSSPSSTRCP